MIADISHWDELRGVIRSRKGGWLVDKGVFSHGYNLLEDLVGEVSFFQVMILNATGRMVESRLAEWFEARQICMSWPDPRIWCNHVGALAGTMKASVAAATAAGILAADSHAYGGSKTSITGLGFIQQALRDYQAGISVEEIVATESHKHGGKPHIMGFARPIAKGDERIVVMERVSEKLGFEVGEHLGLAYEIEKILLRDFDEGMNINGYTSAFLSDQGFTGVEISRISATLVASGVTACYIDSAERPAETFLPMRCEDIDYQGKPPRPLPDKTK